MGVMKTKALARSYIWWPGIDKEIELTAKSCSGCQLTQRELSRGPVHPWEWPSLPWQRIHIDCAGPFLNSMSLVVVDAHSRWLEIERMSTTTSTKTIETLQKMFVRYEVPAQLVITGLSSRQKSSSNSLRETASNTSPQHLTTLPPTA